MGDELNLYDVEIHGTKTRMKLTKEHAEKMGGTSVTSPPTLAQTADPSDEQATAEGDKQVPARTKARTARNKSRSPQTKNE